MAQLSMNQKKVYSPSDTSSGTDHLDRDLIAYLEEYGLNVRRREDGGFALQAIDGPNEYGQYDLVAEWSLVRTA